MAANPIPADPYDLLKTVLEEVRAGRFSFGLTQRAKSLYLQRDYFLSFTEKDEVSYGRAHSLYAEVLDQAGHYTKAHDILKPLVEDGADYLGYMAKADASTYRFGEGLSDAQISTHREAGRQKVMCCLAYGFALYRLNRRGDALEVFDKCEAFLHVLIDKSKQTPYPCWGAQARLFYFKSQLFRSQRDFKKARELSGKALDCAAARLDEKAKEAEEEVSVDEKQNKRAELAIDQLFANHCTGKVLAFGFGWTALLQGELSVAEEHFHAARILLKDSEDQFLKWQVELLSCSAQRATSESYDELKDLIKRIEQCVEKLEQHPVYSLQAKNQLVLCLLAAAEEAQRCECDGRDYLKEARRIVKAVIKEPTTRTETRAIAAALDSRAARALRAPDCREMAEEAYRLAPKNNASVQLEAAIALGEALIAGTKDKALNEKELRDLRDAVKHFEEARSLNKGNMVVDCACCLHLADVHLKLSEHLADVHLKLSELKKAAMYFSDWERHADRIEHTWLRRKASELESALRKSFLIEYNDTRSFAELAGDFFRFLLHREYVRQKDKQNFSPAKAAENLDISPSTINKWRRIISEGRVPQLQLRKSMINPTKRKDQSGINPS